MFGQADCPGAAPGDCACTVCVFVSLQSLGIQRDALVKDNNYQHNNHNRARTTARRQQQQQQRRSRQHQQKQHQQHTQNRAAECQQACTHTHARTPARTHMCMHILCRHVCTRVCARTCKRVVVPCLDCLYQVWCTLYGSHACPLFPAILTVDMSGMT